MTSEVMLTLTLRHVTERMRTPYSRLQRLPVGYISGVQVAGHSRIEIPYSFRGRESYKTISVPTPVARRIVKFVHNHYVTRSSGFSCHSFMRYAAGFDEQPHNGRVLYNGPVITSGPLKPYNGFVMRRGVIRQDDPLHCFLSLPDSQNLSVFGDDSPLIVARNNQLMDAYGADTLIRVTSVSRA